MMLDGLRTKKDIKLDVLFFQTVMEHGNMDSPICLDIVNVSEDYVKGDSCKWYRGIVLVSEAKMMLFTDDAIRK
jgi:hypothetical protein